MIFFGRVHQDDTFNNPKALAELYIKKANLYKEAEAAGFTKKQVLFLKKHAILK